jgi:uncharacterized protein (DUF2267 family)
VVTESVSGGQALRSFVEQVREKAGVDSPQEAEVLVRATLRTVAESITGGQVDDLTSGLPTELRQELRQHRGQARRIDKRGFLDRISGELVTTDEDTTEKQVRAVLSTLRSWAPAKEIDDTVDQLPSSLAELFRS